MSRNNITQNDIQSNVLLFNAWMAQILGGTKSKLPVDFLTLVPTGLYYRVLRALRISIDIPNIDNPLSVDVQQQLLRVFETPEIISRAPSSNLSVFKLNSFPCLRECHCTPLLARRTDSPNVRQLFAEIVLQHAQLLTNIGMPIRIAVLGSAHLLQTIALMATLSRGGVTNFSIDLIERNYAIARHSQYHMGLLAHFLQLISNGFGFSIEKSFCPTQTPCINEMNESVHKFSEAERTNQSTKRPTKVKIHFFGELENYAEALKNEEHSPPTIITEVDFVDKYNAANADYSDQQRALLDLKTQMPNGCFWASANKSDELVMHRGKFYSSGVELTAKVINNADSDNELIAQLFPRHF